MPLSDYRTALLNAIEEYEVEVNHDVSDRRKIDITEIQAIINIKNINSLQSHQEALYKRIGKIETGWWIFQTGRSQLKKKLLAVMKDPQFSLEKLIVENLRKDTEIRFQHLESEAQRYKKQVEAQSHLLSEQQSQLRILHMQQQGVTYYLAYEEYLLNLFSKFIAKQAFSSLEIKQLHWSLQLIQKGGLDKQYEAAVHQSLLKASEFALKTLINDIGSLCVDNKLDLSYLNCINEFASKYLDALVLLKTDSYHVKKLTQVINKLIKSYCEDGAGTTPLCQLPLSDQAAIFSIKENLINTFGNTKQCESMQSIFELRTTNRWDAFKLSCQKHSRSIYQWLKKHSSLFTPLMNETKPEEILQNNLQKPLICVQ